MAVALLALFTALAGTSYAAVTITGKNVKNNSLTGADVTSLRGADVRNSTLTGRDILSSSIAGADIKNEALAARDIKAGSLTADRFAPGQLGSRFALVDENGAIIEQRAASPSPRVPASTVSRGATRTSTSTPAPRCWARGCRSAP